MNLWLNSIWKRMLIATMFFTTAWFIGKIIYGAYCYHGSWQSRGNWGINSKVDVCEKAKHHTELFW